ncbi:MAG TPA: aldehyde ferredoxin oxidoreductase C-terminal domain-containing protein, partial [Dehalococcoidia bacterium]|nr:aldehyde ferredoxin oxidoreductase C-terminal domain-containing protein [Dehalococcoidia bacterium]
DNVLVMAPGVLSGTSAPTSGRISMGGKSPLTGGIKEANAGGNPGQHLMKLGVRAIVVKGQPADREKRYGLVVNEEGAKVVPADEYKGMWNYASCEKLLANYPATASAISIGPAGELGLRGASIACTDQEKYRAPARHAARGGLGAVMGSKGLKWVVVDPGRARPRQPADAAGFNELNKSYSKAYLDGPQIFRFGTSSILPTANIFHTLPYKNRTEGQSPDAANLAGGKIVESFATRGGTMHNCMSGCIVKCSNVVNDESGNYLTSALEFETLALLGSNCAVGKWEDVAELDRLCDEIGVDTVEAGAAIAVLMDAGQMEWGNVSGMKKLLEEVANGTDLGTTVGNGAVAVGKRFNHARVPAVKGQAVPAWDPRPLKATGVTYATSAMGADHTAGLIINPGLPPDQFAVASQEVQLVNAVCDSSGFCQFLQPNLDNIRAFYGAMAGEDVSREQIAEIGWQCLANEWEFNKRAGFTEADDDLPACLREEGVGPGGVMKFDVGTDVIKQAKVRGEWREQLFAQKAAG